MDSVVGRTNDRESIILVYISLKESLKSFLYPFTVLLEFWGFRFCVPCECHLCIIVNVNGAQATN